MFITCLPKNDLGDACISFLHQHGIHTEHVLRGGDRIGIYFLETGVAQRASNVLYDRAGSSFSAIQPGVVDWNSSFSGADWFHWTGITPAVSQGATAVCQEGINVAKKLGLTISCDLNYRSKLWKWTDTPGKIMEKLVGLCDVVIGNEEDAEKLFGIHASDSNILSGKIDPNRYLSVCESLANRLQNISTVAITLRGSLSASHNTWSAVLWHQGQSIIGPSYDILPIVDRVGSGDSFSAGLIYGLLIFGQDYDKSLRFAIASSCLKHSIPGDFNAVSINEIEHLMEGDSSGRIAR